MKSTTEDTEQACPVCGGVMKVARLGNLREYRCHVGHRFGLQTVIAEKTRSVENALWTARSQSEELAALLEQAKRGHAKNAAGNSRDEIAAEAERLKQVQRLLNEILEQMTIPHLDLCGSPDGR